MHRVCRVESARPSVRSSELGPPTLIHERVLPPPFGSQVQGGDKLAFGGRGREDPIPTKEQALWYSLLCTIIPLRNDVLFYMRKKCKIRPSLYYLSQRACSRPYHSVQLIGTVYCTIYMGHTVKNNKRPFPGKSRIKKGQLRMALCTRQPPCIQTGKRL